MKILAVDTALGALSVALTEDRSVLAEDFREMSRGHAEALAPLVDDVMRRAGISFDALDRLAVTTGPGTFTGQRVGLAFMRALALALKKPLIGITTLDAMAEASLASQSDASSAIAAADAKRGEIYLGARARGRSLLAPVLVALSDAPGYLSALQQELGGRIALAGTATELLMPLLSGESIDSGIRQPHARQVAFLSISENPGPPPKPLYLRPPDAKLPGAT